MKMDRRFVSGAQLSARSAEGDEEALVRGGKEALVLGGKGVGYNCLSERNVPMAGCRERFLPGAFRDSLASGQAVTADFNHSDQSLTLGTTKNNTLVLDDRSDGLYFTLRLNPRVQLHRDLYQLVKDRTLSECSFAFGDAEDGWSTELDPEDHTLINVRSVKKARLFGLSIVATPAYGHGATNVDVAARSLRYAIGPSRPVAWDAALRARVAAIGDQIAVEQAELYGGFHEVRIGPGDYDVKFVPFGPGDLDAYFRRRADEIAQEIFRGSAAREKVAAAKRALQELEGK